MKKYIVIEEWTESYTNPIILSKNDIVVVDLSEKDLDPEWDNWVWCIAENGMDGWVPTQIIKIKESFSDQKEAIVLEDYSAYELTINKDDIILGSRILNGWLWCKKEGTDKEGWVPMRNLKALG